ncbi:unnamed protein product [Discosporangium mesarthrocarpum]
MAVHGASPYRIGHSSQHMVRRYHEPSDQYRWGSNLSFQRRERAIWSSCLQTIQGLRQGGPDGSQAQGEGPCASLLNGERNIRLEERCFVEGGNNGLARTAEAELLAQLDLLGSLTYPNTSISPQDAGLMVTALCEAVPPSSELLCPRVAQFFISLCVKQQKVALSGWQIEVTLNLFLHSLETPSSKTSLLAHEAIRAIAQLLYDYGHRVSKRGDSMLALLLHYADLPSVDLEARHAALDALSNLCLKGWAGLSDQTRTSICGTLARNFLSHWQTPTGSMVEIKVLASAARGLAHTIAHGGVAVLKPSLPRVIHTLNHLVQPEEGTTRGSGRMGPRSETAGGGFPRKVSPVGTGEGRGTGVVTQAPSLSTGSGSGSGRGGCRSRSRSPVEEEGIRTRSPARATPADLQARVRLQCMAMLEALAAGDPKGAPPHPLNHRRCCRVAWFF